MKYKCNCCGYYTLFEDPANPTFEICPVCYWENDTIQNEHQTYSGGANELNLYEAKRNFQIYGAIEKKYMTKVRKPFFNEIK